MNKVGCWRTGRADHRPTMVSLANYSRTVKSERIHVIGEVYQKTLPFTPKMNIYAKQKSLPFSLTVAEGGECS